MYTEAYQTYLRLLEELNGLFDRNLGDSRASEKVRNLMDELWPQLSEIEKRGLRLPSDFWNTVEEKMREWGYTSPSEVLKLHIYGTDGALEKVIAKERYRAGNKAAMELLGKLISRITGEMG